MPKLRDRPNRARDTKLASRLDFLIEKKAKKFGLTKQDVLRQMARAAGISEFTVRNIVNVMDNPGAILGDGIPLRRLVGFAKVLSVSLKSLTILLPKNATAKKQLMERK